MSLVSSLLFLLTLAVVRADLNCKEVPGDLVQIDAGNGQVIGVDENDNIYFIYYDKLTQIPGGLNHVTVGPAGVWGTTRNTNIYKMVGGIWDQIEGQLKQIDAGGDQFVVGVDKDDDIYCMNKRDTLAVKDGSSAPLKSLEGKLDYYSCGSDSCWGVSDSGNIYFRHSVTPSSCAGSEWQNVPGKLSMIEVGGDGSVYGTTKAGGLYQRDGVSEANPVGTDWTELFYKPYKIKHASSDNNILWLITEDQKILKCQV